MIVVVIVEIVAEVEEAEVEEGWIMIVMTMKGEEVVPGEDIAVVEHLDLPAEHAEIMPTTIIVAVIMITEAAIMITEAVIMITEAAIMIIVVVGVELEVVVGLIKNLIQTLDVRTGQVSGVMVIGEMTGSKMMAPEPMGKETKGPMIEEKSRNNSVQTGARKDERTEFLIGRMEEKNVVEVEVMGNVTVMSISAH